MAKVITVSRCQFANSGGYQVKIGTGGPGHTKFFSDIRYGSAKKAFEVASEFRDLTAEYSAAVYVLLAPFDGPRPSKKKLGR